VNLFVVVAAVLAGAANVVLYTCCPIPSQAAAATAVA
jgi:hypothetical protein